MFVCVCEVLARDSSCPLGFANVALPPLQQHGTGSVFVVKPAVCGCVIFFCMFVCECPGREREREGSNKNQQRNYIKRKKKKEKQERSENAETNQAFVRVNPTFGC